VNGSLPERDGVTTVLMTNSGITTEEAERARGRLAEVLR
jgi:hypothetical protein